MQNLIMYKKGENSWVRWIKKRIKHNLNFMALLEGPTGIGKSWSSCRIAYDLDNKFNPKEQVCFSFKDIMRIINRFNDPNDELSKRAYKVIVFDEVQVDLSNREWMNKIHRLFGYLTTTFRNQNIILLFTSPYSDFIDSATMKLIHARFEVKGWNKKTSMTHIRPKILQYNSKLKKFYEHSLYVIKNKQTKKMTDWFLPRPPEQVIQFYEEMKTNFTQELNKRITMELEGIGYKQIGQAEKQVEKPIEIIEIEPNSKEKILFCLKKGIKKQKDIVKETGLRAYIVNYHMKRIKKEINPITVVKYRENIPFSPQPDLTYIGDPSKSE
jgi:hypothetical protein